MYHCMFVAPPHTSHLKFLLVLSGHVQCTAVAVSVVPFPQCFELCPVWRSRLHRHTQAARAGHHAGS